MRFSTYQSIRPLVVVAFCVAAMGEAQATIQSVDLSASAHDQWLTRDTASGLDWLDVPLTAGLSVDQVRTGVWAQQGFRYATSLELQGLLRNAVDSGVTLLALNQALGAAAPASPSSGPAYEIDGLLIDPSTSGSAPTVRLATMLPSGASGSLVDLSGYLGAINGGATAGSADSSAQENLLAQLAEGQSPLGPLFFRDNVSATFSASWAGSFLVRGAPAVPEPGTFALMVAGGAVVAAVARHRVR